MKTKNTENEMKTKNTELELIGYSEAIGNVEQSLNRLVALVNDAIDSTRKCQPNLRLLGTWLNDSDVNQQEPCKSEPVSMADETLAL